MSKEGSVDQTDSEQQLEQTNIILLDDETEEKVGAISGRTPPIPAVGDLVSLNNFQFDTTEETARPRSNDDMSFRVVDRALHYSVSSSEGGEEVTTEVLLYVVSKEEWAVRRQRGA